MKKFNIDGNSKEAVDKFLQDNEREVWHLILEAIEDCIENDLDDRLVFEIEPDIDRLCVFRYSFKETLETGIKIFEKYEDYEQCAKCTNILKKIKY